MNKFRNLFGEKKLLIAMIHTQAGPGCFNYKGNVSTIIRKALEEAQLYKDMGIDTVMIENMHDLPYLNKDVGHEVSTLLSIIAYEIKQKTNLKCGIQILAGANKQAIAVANSAGLDFIRAESYVFSHIADEGIMHADAGELKRYQKYIGADDILIFTDIKKKHSSHAITNDIDIAEFAKAAQFFLSDAVIVTGNSTAEAAHVEDVISIVNNTDIPILVGSGITDENLSEFFYSADGFIVGSYFKKDGNWANEIDSMRIKKFINSFINMNH